MSQGKLSYYTHKILRMLRDMHHNQGLIQGMRRALFAGGPVKPTNHEFVGWVCFSNPGMLVPGNVYSFEYAVKNLPSSAPMVEIVSFSGLSANLISHFKEKYASTSPLFTCDRWIFEGAQDESRLLGESLSVTHGEYRQFVKGNFIRNLQMFSRNNLPHTIEVFSDEFFQLWADQATVTDVFGRQCTLGGPISFCYIDGNHTYDFAKRDFENCDKYLQVGGFVLFDDSGDGSGWEVCRVIREVIQTGRYEVVAANPNYLFRKLR